MEVTAEALEKEMSFIDITETQTEKVDPRHTTKAFLEALKKAKIDI
jgi:hypothetical protein